MVTVTLTAVKRTPRINKVCEICLISFTKISSHQSWNQFNLQRFCGMQCRNKWLSKYNKEIGRLPPSAKGKIMGLSQKNKLRITLKRAWSNPSLREKLSLQRRGKPNIHFRGSLNPNWKGGITPLNAVLRTSLEYKNWRRSVFERDNFTCQECGVRSGNGKKVILNADHIKPFAYFPEVRFNIDNGRTLCSFCHKKTDTFAFRARKLYELNN